MSEQVDVSVIISTYNRSDILPAALESVLAQEEMGDVIYEVIVVDNNSTDRTRKVVESFIARGHTNLRYIFEGKQGLSYARNTGIANARAPIIAFTDDDVRVERDWLANIKRAFDKHPEVDFVGGKVLPRWENEPPSWLTREHWSPLALQDYGDAPFYVNTERQICLVGANLSFRRTVFEQMGLFAVDVQRFKDSIGSMEDHELQTRILLAKRQGLYAPASVVAAEVQMARLSKKYHRRWHMGHGHFYAVLRDEAMERSVAHLFGVPAHLYRQAVIDAAAWLAHALQGGVARAFTDETRLHFFIGFFRKRRRDYLAGSGRRSIVREVAAFVRALITGETDTAGEKREPIEKRQ